MRPLRRLMLRAIAATGVLGVAGIAARAQATPRVIPIAAHKFTYDPDVVTAKLNEPVIFRLTSLDVVMGFSVPDFAVRGTIIPGQVTDVALTPSKAGEFTFLCDVFCGTGHEEMNGTLRVVA